jgi:hypothetical protein
VVERAGGHRYNSQDSEKKKREREIIIPTSQGIVRKEGNAINVPGTQKVLNK